MKFKIIGAGTSGLLAAALLRNEAECVYEKQEELPNNHKSLLRFRSPIVGNSVGIPFKKVRVLKEVEPGMTEIASHLLYSKKVTGRLSLRSSISTARSEIVERYIAPPDFIKQLAEKVSAPIKYSTVFWPLAVSQQDPIISTIPMRDLMDDLEYKGERPVFKSIAGVTLSAHIEDCDAYVTMYATDIGQAFYRVSITGDQLIVEYAYPDHVGGLCAAKNFITDCGSETAMMDLAQVAMEFLGLEDETVSEPVLSLSQYQKISEVDEGLRHRFMIWATDNHGVYSLGRFATWRPSVQMDDLVKDVAQIRRMAVTGTYNARKA